MDNSILLIVIGLSAGVISGFFGVGGGLVIVPALVYLLGFSQQRATGTSLAVLLPPVGLGAVLVYWKSGNVDLKAAIIVAVCLFCGAGLASLIANRIPAPVLKLLFGVFITIVGCFTIYSSVRTLSTTTNSSSSG